MWYQLPAGFLWHRRLAGGSGPRPRAAESRVGRAHQFGGYGFLGRASRGRLRPAIRGPKNSSFARDRNAACPPNRNRKSSALRSNSPHSSHSRTFTPILRSVDLSFACFSRKPCYPQRMRTARPILCVPHLATLCHCNFATRPAAASVFLSAPCGKFSKVIKSSANSHSAPCRPSAFCIRPSAFHATLPTPAPPPETPTLRPVRLCNRISTPTQFNIIKVRGRNLIILIILTAPRPPQPQHLVGPLNPHSEIRNPKSKISARSLSPFTFHVSHFTLYAFRPPLPTTAPQTARLADNAPPAHPRPAHSRSCPPPPRSAAPANQTPATAASRPAPNPPPRSTPAPPRPAH